MAVEEFQPTRKWFLKLTLRTKWIMPGERALKTVPENGVRRFVHFCLRSLWPFEKCGRSRARFVAQSVQARRGCSGFGLRFWVVDTKG